MTNNIYKDLDLVGMKKVASEIATTLKIGDVVKLNGDLGAGKTTFAGFLINALLEKTEVVTSPTFNLLHEYKAPQGKIYHFDLYRLKSSDELENIGIYDAFQFGISIIEWPDTIKVKYPQKTLKILISTSEISSNLRDLLIIS